MSLCVMVNSDVHKYVGCDPKNVIDAIMTPWSLKSDNNDPYIKICYADIIPIGLGLTERGSMMLFDSTLNFSRFASSVFGYSNFRNVEFFLLDAYECGCKTTGCDDELVHDYLKTLQNEFGISSFHFLTTNYYVSTYAIRHDYRPLVGKNYAFGDLHLTQLQSCPLPFVTAVAPTFEGEPLCFEDGYARILRVFMKVLGSYKMVYEESLHVSLQHVMLWLLTGANVCVNIVSLLYPDVMKSQTRIALWDMT